VSCALDHRALSLLSSFAADSSPRLATFNIAQRLFHVSSFFEGGQHACNHVMKECYPASDADW
jgi:hypothetical protein